MTKKFKLELGKTNLFPPYKSNEGSEQLWMYVCWGGEGGRMILYFQLDSSSSSSSSPPPQEKMGGGVNRSRWSPHLFKFMCNHHSCECEVWSRDTEICFLPSALSVNLVLCWSQEWGNTFFLWLLGHSSTFLETSQNRSISFKHPSITKHCLLEDWFMAAGNFRRLWVTCTTTSTYHRKLEHYESYEWPNYCPPPLFLTLCSLLFNIALLFLVLFCTIVTLCSHSVGGRSNFFFVTVNTLCSISMYF